MPAGEVLAPDTADWRERIQRFLELAASPEHDRQIGRDLPFRVRASIARQVPLQNPLRLITCSRLLHQHGTNVSEIVDDVAKVRTHW
jgi:Flp pilus assembly protein TadB